MEGNEQKYDTPEQVQEKVAVAEVEKKNESYDNKLDHMKRDYEIALAKEQLDAIKQERKDSKFFKFRSQVDFTVHTSLMAFVVWSALMTMKYYGVI